MPQSQHNRELVARAHHALFTERDVTALERCFSPEFLEHSPLVQSGLDGLRELVTSHAQLRHDARRILADGELVAIHGRYEGLDVQPCVGFDIYRVADGKIVEHWDGLVPEAERNASSRSQLDGATLVDSGQDRAHNRALICRFFQETLIEGDYTGFRRFTDGVKFIQHSPDIADGVEEVIAFLERLKSTGNALVYDRIHRTVADGPFVLTHSEGRISGQRHAFFELWHVSEGKLDEMWDAIMPVPDDADAKHPHGIF